ncbi:MAG: lipase secretion chaperone [Oleiphilaceae bacterium]|nr:lipase secretion chaperone [Oleiphilaceae bacterium]
MNLSKGHWLTLAGVTVAVALGTGLMGYRGDSSGPEQTAQSALQEPVQDFVERPQETGTARRAGRRVAAGVSDDGGLPALPGDEVVEGLDVDGGVRLDRNGNLVLDIQLRRLLGFFIGLTRGPEDEPALKKRIAAHMAREGIPESVRLQVLEILVDYLDYREAGEALVNNGGDALEQTFERLYSLRRDRLGPEVAEGFFAEDEARVRRALDRRRIMEDESLSEAQRRQALAQLEQGLPEASRERLEQSRRLSEVSRQVTAMREEGGSELAIHRLRAEKLGPEAAQRLASLDERRHQWQRKLSAYQASKERIENARGLSPQDREKALEGLLEEHFDTDHEIRRARALARIRD